MPTTKAQRESACAIIEKFTDDVVTFPVEFVLALLNDADERDRLDERVRELEEELDDTNREAAFGLSAILHRAEAAEAKLAAAVEALEDIAHDAPTNPVAWKKYTQDYARNTIAKIKGAP